MQQPMPRLHASVSALTCTLDLIRNPVPTHPALPLTQNGTFAGLQQLKELFISGTNAWQALTPTLVLALTPTLVLALAVTRTLRLILTLTLALILTLFLVLTLTLIVILGPTAW